MEQKWGIVDKNTDVLYRNSDRTVCERILELMKGRLPAEMELSIRQLQVLDEEEAVKLYEHAKQGNVPAELGI